MRKRNFNNNEKEGGTVSYSKLRGRIKEVYGTQMSFAIAMDMNPATLSLKLSGKVDWTRAEMEKACSLLSIPMYEMHVFFYCPKNCENAIT